VRESPPMQPVWEIEDLRKRYGGGWLRLREPHVAVDGVSLTVNEGERVALIGESGSGKTTLARCGLGLVPRDGGAVRLFGEDTAGWGESRWRAARKHAQLLFQDPRAMLNPAMTLGQLLRESAALHRPAADPNKEAARVLSEVGLSGRDRALPGELSGGEMRRAGIARLLLARPKLVVADEPTAGLDAALKASLIELLLDRVGPRCAVVLISHDLPVVAWACERIVVMQAGRVVDAFRTSEMGSGRHPYTVRLLAAAGMAA
jgi:ABC-type glutathione transport system ATPase component